MIDGRAVDRLRYAVLTPVAFHSCLYKPTVFHMFGQGFLDGNEFTRPPFVGFLYDLVSVRLPTSSKIRLSY